MNEKKSSAPKFWFDINKFEETESWKKAVELLSGKRVSIEICCKIDFCMVDKKIPFPEAYEQVVKDEKSIFVDDSDRLLTCIPTKCHWWTKDPFTEDDLIGSWRFVAAYEDTNHTEKSLVECTRCGQKYYYEYLEVCDFVSGDDSHYSTFIPINPTEEALQKLRNKSPQGLLDVTPRLIWDDTPKRGKVLKWIR